MFIESDVEGDPYEVSDADTMLAYVAPECAAKPNVVVFTRTDCPHCARAKTELTGSGYDYREVEIGTIGGMETLRHHRRAEDSAGLRRRRAHRRRR